MNILLLGGVVRVGWDCSSLAVLGNVTAPDFDSQEHR